MKLAFTAPLDEAHVEILVCFDVDSTSFDPTELNTVLTGNSPDGALCNTRQCIARVNGQLKYFLALTLISPSRAVSLGTFVANPIQVELPALSIGESSKVEAIAFTHKNAATTISASST